MLEGVRFCETMQGGPPIGSGSRRRQCRNKSDMKRFRAYGRTRANTLSRHGGEQKSTTPLDGAAPMPQAVACGWSGDTDMERRRLRKRAGVPHRVPWQKDKCGAPSVAHNAGLCALIM